VAATLLRGWPPAAQVIWLLAGLLILGGSWLVLWKGTGAEVERKDGIERIAPSARAAGAEKGAFQPPAQGRISPTRLQAFLEVRRRVRQRGYQPRAQALRAFATSRHPGAKEVREILTQLGAIQAEQIRALAEVGMSREEYLWLLRTVSEVLTVESLEPGWAASGSPSAAQLEKAAAAVGRELRPALDRDGGRELLQAELAYQSAGSPQAGGNAAAARQAASVLRANEDLVGPYRAEFEAFEALDIDELILAAPASS
jgi:hypothetical protein